MINLESLDTDIECAVSHLVTFSLDEIDIEEKREILINEFKNKLKLKNFSNLDLKNTIRKHNDDFTNEEYYYLKCANSENKTLDEFYEQILSYPSIIIESNDQYFVLDGQHRINQLIKIEKDYSEHMVVSLNELPKWTLTLLQNSFQNYQK